MARWARRCVGIGIIGAGFCAASQFRVDPPRETITIRESQATNLRSTDITLQLAPSPMTQPVSQEWEEVSAEDTDQGMEGGTRSSLSGRQPPPKLATDYPSLEERRVSAPTVTFGELALEHERASPLTHTIQDGDSLESLARRYLGDADQWQVLLDANKDVLTSSDLLPVKTVIKIPPPDESGGSLDSSQQASDDDLVPVLNH